MLRYTKDEYSQLQRAFDHFNKALFEGSLPQVLVTFQRNPRSKGHYAAGQFRGRHRDVKDVITDEIALNPECFDRSDEEILSTLVHEMAHLWQNTFGTPGRRGYHNREWAELMKSLGLQPTDTGTAGGKETGEAVTHCILPCGPFALACRDFLRGTHVLTLKATPDLVAGAKTNKQTRQKFVCPECGLAAWAKPGAHLLCGDCTDEDSVRVVLEAE